MTRKRQHGHHGRDAHEQPDYLVQSQIGRQPRDERDADARQHEHDGEDGRIGVGGEEADGDMGDDERGEDAQRHPQRRQAQPLALVQRQHDEQQDDDGRTHAQQHEF